MSLLPEASITKRIAEVTAAAQALAASQMAKFVGNPMRGEIDSLVELLLPLKAKQMPELKQGKLTPLLQECVDRLPFFVEVLAENHEVLHRGKVALDHILNELKKILTKKDT